MFKKVPVKQRTLKNSKSNKSISKAPPKSAVNRKSKKINDLQPILKDNNLNLKSKVALAQQANLTEITQQHNKSKILIVQPFSNNRND